MQTSARTSRPFTRLFTIVSLATTMALAACGGDGTEVEDPAGAPPAAEAQLTSSLCATFARKGTVDICHVGEEGGELANLKVSPESCSGEHAAHTGDFLASEQTGCKHAKPAGGGGGKCKTSGSSCSLAGAGECCSLTCLQPIGAKRPYCL